MKPFRFGTAILFLMSILVTHTLEAKEHQWTHFGLRPLGMGNAYVAVADDYNALFYNPAGLARLKGWDGELLNPAFSGATVTRGFVSDLGDALSGKLSSLADALALFEKQTGKTHHVGVSLTPHLIFPGFGIGIGFDLGVSMLVHSDIEVELDAGTQAIIPVSYAHNFLNNKLSVGATLKGLFNAGIDESFNIETISALIDSNSIDGLVKAGSGVGLDLGLLFTPVDTMEPTLGISITDLGGTQFTAIEAGTDLVAAPKTRLTSINTGVSLKPFKSGRQYILVAADAHSINQAYHYSHKFNLGFEWGYGDILKLQTGLKEGLLTAGMQFDVGLLSMRLATYAIDHGSVVGLHDDLVERRVLLQFKLLI